MWCPREQEMRKSADQKHREAQVTHGEAARELEKKGAAWEKERAALQVRWGRLCHLTACALEEEGCLCFSLYALVRHTKASCCT